MQMLDMFGVWVEGIPLFLFGILINALQQALHLLY